MLKNSATRIIIFIIYVSLLTSLYRAGSQYFRTQEQLTLAKITLTEEKEKELELEKRLRDIEKNSYVERVARDQLGLGLADEIVLVLPPPEDLRKLSPSHFAKEREVKETSETNIQAWLRLLM